MKTREMYALLFEPAGGWADAAHLAAEFAVYERLLKEEGEVRPGSLARAFDKQKTSIFLCSEHGGIGFVSDCGTCRDDHQQAGSST